MTIANIKWTLILTIISQRDVEHIMTLLIKTYTLVYDITDYKTITSVFEDFNLTLSVVHVYHRSSYIVAIVIISIPGLSIYFKCTSTSLVTGHVL